MALNDTLANGLSLILNNENIGKQNCIVRPASNILKEILTVMKEAGYVQEFEEVEDGKGNHFKIVLTGNINKCGVVKPRYSVRVGTYEKFEKRYLPAKDVGILIISTNQGVVTHYIAKEKKIGGKLLAYCY
tara:strand:- start:11462 stop:11854 length:393 start_codon:yes stop_codon:yes gene_type:complete